eukprot:227591-Pyramimonas_sp.AAC.1
MQTCAIVARAPGAIAHRAGARVCRKKEVGRARRQARCVQRCVDRKRRRDVNCIHVIRTAGFDKCLRGGRICTGHRCPSRKRENPF